MPTDSSPGPDSGHASTPDGGPVAFPDKTVWSHFGSGYGYVPLVLPVIGLMWLRSVRRSAGVSR